jgi:quinol monooxygenase YgiN
MAREYVRHTVKDYAAWRIVYDQHDAVRKSSGCTKADVFVNSANPNEVLVVTEWDSVEHSHKFAESANLKETMMKAGVISMPEITYA